MSCRAALDATYGFTRESRAMKNGVFVVQSFDCKADKIVASVSLTNHSGDPMYCFAQTETAQRVSGSPPRRRDTEYTYASTAYQDCERID